MHLTGYVMHARRFHHIVFTVIQLHLHCTEEEIEGDPGTPRSRTRLSTPTAASTPPHTPLTPRTPVHRQRSLSPPSRPPSRLDANAPVFVPLSARGPSQLREEVQVGNSDIPEPDTVPSGVCGSYTGDDPDAEYVRLKLEIDALPKGNDPESVERSRLLKARLDDVKRNYFFREKVSEARYRLERERLGSEALEARLHGLSDLRTPSETAPPSNRQQLDVSTTEMTRTSVDIFDGDSDDESPGGLFEILQEVPKTETTASGSTVRLHPMAVPKHWSDRLPKAILQETITKKDKYVVAKYACVSGPSRIRRASLTISWDGGKIQSWSMDDVGCPDLQQAEQYVATVALHALTFPPLEGFALGGTSAANTPTFFRRLPPVFRDLWDELETKRRELGDATNRAAWEKLRAIARVKLDFQSKVWYTGCYNRICLTCYAVDWQALKSHG